MAYSPATGTWTADGQVLDEEQVRSVYPYLVTRASSPDTSETPRKSKGCLVAGVSAVTLVVLACTLVPVIFFLTTCTGAGHPSSPRDDQAALAAFRSANATAAPLLEIRVTGYEKKGFYWPNEGAHMEYNVQFYDIVARDRTTGLEGSATVQANYGESPSAAGLFPDELEAEGIRALLVAWKGREGKGIPALYQPTGEGWTPLDPKLWGLEKRIVESWSPEDGLPPTEYYYVLEDGGARLVGEGIGRATVPQAANRYNEEYGTYEGFDARGWLEASPELAARYRDAWRKGIAAGVDPDLVASLADVLVAGKGETVVSVGKGGQRVVATTDRGTWTISYDLNGSMPFFTKAVDPGGNTVDFRE